MEAQSEVEKLKSIIEEKNREIERLKKLQGICLHETLELIRTGDTVIQCDKVDKLTNAEISRYSRQLILPQIGVKGQLSLRNKSVLIVGAGGLGCPAAIYLAAAGIGTLGIIDYDEVELSNLHRQILHRESSVGMCKSLSAATACQQLNSHVKCVPYHLQLDSSNALQIIQQYDIVLDATDNVATRYLLNDACVLAGKPLVSGSALRFEGQLTVYNYKGSPCYRCLHPQPPPPHLVTNCSEGGVLGVVPGIIGCLQAMEAIKIAAGLDPNYSQKLLVYDGSCGSFHVIKLRGRQTKCPVCGDKPTIKHLIDYEQFCGAKASDKDKELTLLPPSERISVKNYKEMLDNSVPHVLIDVRQECEIDICHLPTDFINIPMDALQKQDSEDKIRERISAISTSARTNTVNIPVVFVCRQGNDSQIAVQEFKNVLKNENVTLLDITGGLNAWARKIDLDFPTY